MGNRYWGGASDIGHRKSAMTQNCTCGCDEDFKNRERGGIEEKAPVRMKSENYSVTS